MVPEPSEAMSTIRLLYVAESADTSDHDIPPFVERKILADIVGPVGVPGNMGLDMPRNTVPDAPCLPVSTASYIVGPEKEPLRVHERPASVDLYTFQPLEPNRTPPVVEKTLDEPGGNPVLLYSHVIPSSADLNMPRSVDMTMAPPTLAKSFTESP